MVRGMSNTNMSNVSDLTPLAQMQLHKSNTKQSKLLGTMPRHTIAR